MASWLVMNLAMSNMADIVKVALFGVWYCVLIVRRDEVKANSKIPPA